ncbi:MAG: NAD-dependent 4,6-dehydratase LegB [Pseudomonadota bacterium]|nr:NAD-dependent 4,6-dehydratase LegB [Pseudomonadota bacterium]
MYLDEFSGRKVFVTGADGFIGSHLVEALVASGASVVAFVYYNSFNSWGWLDSLSSASVEKIEIIAGDIRDPYAVAAAMDGCDIVFHLAALIAIPFSYNSPDTYVDTNIKGTLNVLQAARRQPVSRILVTSTSEVYGTAKYVPIDEKHPFQGQSPYSASKIGADRLAESFYRSFGLPVTIVRPFNTYGPRQSARAVIPTLIMQFLEKVDCLKVGDLRPTRDFNYVEDTVSGFLALAASDQTIGEEVNIASCSELSVQAVVELLAQIFEYSPEILVDRQRLRPATSEVERLFGCNSKIKKLTGWSPQFSFEDGLRRTVDWFSRNRNLEWYKTDIYNI